MSAVMKAPGMSRTLPMRATGRSARSSVVCLAQQDAWRSVQGVAAGALFSAALLTAQPALADLNKYEEALGGEFGNGSAQQYGEADIKGRDFSNEDLRRANFTSADCRGE